MWFLALLTTGIILLLYVYLIWNYNYWKRRGVPGPKSYPAAGSFPKAFFQKVNVLDEIDVIYRTFRGSSPFTGIFSGRSPQLMILDPNIIKNILIKDFKYFQNNEFADLINEKADPILSRNPFLLKGEEWKEKRAEITPAFTASKLKAMFPIIDDVCRKMDGYLQRQLKDESTVTMDAKELAAKFTTDVVSSCIYGVDSKAFTDEQSIIRKMGTAIFTPSTMQIIYFILISVFPYVRYMIELPFVSKKIETFFTELMKDAVKLRLESGKSRDDYLNYLLELKKKKNISELDMAAHTITFFFDGFETSSVVISHILLMLAKHKDVQQKLRDEINQAIKDNGDITFDNINDLTYLDQVFNETVRLYPPAGVLSKKCTIPTEFTDYKDKKIPIEKDIVAMIPVLSVHRDPEYYANPLKFDPDRFSVENGGIKKYKDQGVYLPFGDGPRVCLGMRFGITQSKAAICSITQKYQISVNPKTKEPYVIDPKQFITMPVGGMWIDLKNL